MHGTVREDSSSVSSGISVSAMHTTDLFIIGAPAFHIIAYASLFGMLQWVTWIGGIVQFKNLPRQQFGNLQSKLFPWYFRLGVLSNAILLYTYLQMHPGLLSKTRITMELLTDAEQFQLFLLATSLIAQLANMLSVGPWSTDVMFQKHKLEKSSNPNEAQLAALSRKFNMLHGVSSLLNLWVWLAMIPHGLYLAYRINL
eukprot:TRINITY_DN10362_c0_g1_i1.p2 TRINITY_DN10362_c0_g1~~TRINITY_DN10362_c0_g1_i1.p2  ORF type:complete len:199 (-),score=29.70 TRINITY_DN10362_c0_g1_i1:43-639(-)